MFFELNNSTVSASDDQGDLYYASFDFFPKCQGDSKYIFKGMMFGRGPKNERKCAVKLMKDTFAKRPDQWRSHIMAAETAHQIATVFNNAFLKDGRAKLKFRIPFTALMDTVTGSYAVAQFFAACVGKNLSDCKPDKNEYVLVEEYIRGDFRQLNANNGWMSTNPTYSELQAFAHFTWCYSGGELVVSDVQGVRKSNHYLLTDPGIDSKGFHFGERDGGQVGIEQFFQQHHCNEICQNWSRPWTPDVNYTYDDFPDFDKFNINNNVNDCFPRWSSNDDLLSDKHQIT